VVIESSKGQLGGWFKAIWFDKSLLILIENINKNYFSSLVIQYGTLFYRLPLKRFYRRRILENLTFRKESWGKEDVDNKKVHFQGNPGVEDYFVKHVSQKNRAFLEKSL
jgi:hypothetical protein